VALLSLREVAAGPVQRPFLVECEFPVGPHVRSRPRPAGTVGPATAGPGQAAQTGRTRSDPSSRRGQPPSLAAGPVRRGPARAGRPHPRVSPPQPGPRVTRSDGPRLSGHDERAGRGCVRRQRRPA
jgi:hypothetical protein